jgi:hypothetical protein
MRMHGEAKTKREFRYAVLYVGGGDNGPAIIVLMLLLVVFSSSKYR